MTEKEWRKEENRIWDGLARKDMVDFPYKLETMIQLINNKGEIY